MYVVTYLSGFSTPRPPGWLAGWLLLLLLGYSIESDVQRNVSSKGMHLNRLRWWYFGSVMKLPLRSTKAVTIMCFLFITHSTGPSTPADEEGGALIDCVHEYNEAVVCANELQELLHFQAPQQPQRQWRCSCARCSPLTVTSQHQTTRRD